MKKYTFSHCKFFVKKYTPSHYKLIVKKYTVHLLIVNLLLVNWAKCEGLLIDFIVELYNVMKKKVCPGFVHTSRPADNICKTKQSY